MYKVVLFQKVGIDRFHCVLNSYDWNRGVPLYTEMFSFQEVRIEEFHCIQRLSSFQGVRIEEFHCIQRYLHFRGLEEGFHCIHGVPLYTRNIQRCPHFGELEPFV